MAQNEPTERKKPQGVRLVVIGASGFIGRGLAARAEASSWEVLGLSSADLDLTAEDAGGALAKLLRPTDHIVMLSALTPDRGRGIGTFCANMGMIRSLVSAVRETPVAHLVYLSSDAVYSFRQEEIDEDSPPEPVDLYGSMHLSRELALKEVVDADRLALVRMTMVYGAGDPHNSYGPNRLRRMAAKNGEIRLFGKGEETRDHLYIRDAVETIFRIAAERASGLINLASGEAVSYDDLARRIAALDPADVSVVHQERNNAITHRSFDTKRLCDLFPDLTFTSLDDGLALVQAERQSPDD